MVETYYVNTVFGDDTWDGLSRTDEGSGVGPWKTIVFAGATVGSSGTLTDHTVVNCAGGEDSGVLVVNNGNSGGPWDITFQADEVASDGLYTGTGFSSSHYYMSSNNVVVSMARYQADLAVPQLKTIQVLTKRTPTARETVRMSREVILERVRIFNNEAVANRGIDMALSTIHGYGHIIACQINMTQSLGGFGGTKGGRCMVVGTATAARTYKVHNSILTGGSIGLEIIGSTNDTFEFYGNLIFDNTDDVADNSSGTNIYNDAGNAIEDNNDETWQDETAWISIADSDWSLSTDLEDHTNEDYRPANGGSLDGAGSSSSLAVTDLADIAFTSPPSIGAFEAVAAAGGFNLYSGTNLIPRVYHGSDEIFAIYEGSNLRWEK